MKLKTLNSIYPEHLISKILEEHNMDLGTLSGRTEYFLMCWNNWSENQVQLVGNENVLAGSMYQIPSGRFNTESVNAQQKLRQIAEENGLHEFWDFIIKGNVVRFRRKDDALYYRLAL